MPYISIDVDLDEFSTPDLVRELKDRGKGPEVFGGDDVTETDVDIEPIYQALYLGNETEAVRLMRKYVQDATGRTLP